jgi:N-methylhydantoinase A
VEVVHIRVQGRVPGRTVVRRAIAERAPESGRRAYFGGQYGMLETPVVQRGNIESTARAGPLIVEEYDATTLVPPGWRIRRDGRDNLLIERA